MIFIVQIYDANFIAKFRWESDFLNPLLGTNGSVSTLVT